MPSPTPPPKYADTLPPYDPFDPVPLPDVQEKNSDTIWQMWNDVKDKEHARFADTVPVTNLGAVSSTQRTHSQPPGAPLRPAPSTGTSGLEKLIEESRRNNRVCPRPGKWIELDALVRSAVAAGAATATLPPPLSERDWKSTTSLAKRLMFRSVIDWAAGNGQVETVLGFVRALPEEQWHHMGE